MPWISKRFAAISPRSSQRSAALVSFGLAGWKGEELSQALREEWNMIIKPLPRGREGLRASLPFFLLESEIDELLAALNSLTKQRSKTR